MASPDMFRLSPSRLQRRTAASPVVISSSPDLPSLRKLLGSPPPRPPVFKPSAANTPPRLRSRSALSLAVDCGQETENLSLGSENAAHSSHYRIRNEADGVVQAKEDDIARRTAFNDTERLSVLCASSTRTSPETGVEASPSSKVAKDSVYFRQTSSKPSDPKSPGTITTKQAGEGPLNLERAPARRMDWTPPRQKTTTYIDSDPVVVQPNDNQVEKAAPFPKVLEAFKCRDMPNSAGAAKSDQEENVFRKRKLIEPVSAKPVQNASEQKGPVQTKAKTAAKKKPRTITGLATAAYRLASQPDHPDESIAQADESRDSTAMTTAEAPQNIKAAKMRKRTARPSKTKKKEHAPKPILLSPSAALRQVANQHFVFGTSSQLAQEQCPQFLRDLAEAVKQSNEMDCIDLSTPINSDTIEPPEAKRSLWNAAARDEDGDLFDTEIQELVQKSPTLPAHAAHVDPFGYMKGEASPAQDDSFLNLSDILLPRTEKAVASKKDECSTVVASSAPCSHDGELTPAAPASPKAAPRPKFEIYTDAQLASAVSSYGFKNVRPRAARIALLDKCWKGQNQVGNAAGATRSASSLGGSSKARSPAKTRGAAKSAGGKIKASRCASQPQEPPPSAQPTSPPKRPRGRPRKTEALTAASEESAELAASSSATLPVSRKTRGPSTPKRARKKARRSVVEILNSESDESGEEPAAGKKASRCASQSQEPPSSAQPTSSPKRPRGRPRKTEALTAVSEESAKSAAALSSAALPVSRKTRSPSTPKRARKKARRSVVEISDSESDESGEELSRSPGSGSGPDECFSASEAIGFSLSMDEDSSLSTSMEGVDEKRSGCFKYIGKAITSAPRTRDVDKPSWYEKILLYDPIVLEDLAAWLNCGPLTEAGYDDEVSSMEVKKWCESKSICCLWKMSHRGKERKQF